MMEHNLIEEDFDNLSCPSGRKLPNGWATLTIDTSLMSKEQLDKLFQAEQLLLDIGVHFDTGYGGGGRDWELDWSLSGATLTVRPMECMAGDCKSVAVSVFGHWQGTSKRIYAYTYCSMECLRKDLANKRKSGWILLAYEK